MNTLQTIINSARLETATSFCAICEDHIKQELAKVKGVNHVRCYPLDALICFTFKNAIDISNVLNVLSELGIPEKGEAIKMPKQSYLQCAC